MKDEDLDKFLGAAKRTPIPACPGSLETNVLRRIRLSQQEAEGSFWDWLPALLPKPAIAAAMLAIVVTVSSGITAVTTQRYVSSAQNHQLASNALDFGVFASGDLLNLNHREP